MKNESNLIIMREWLIDRAMDKHRQTKQRIRDRINKFLSGAEGEKMMIYLDDHKIEAIIDGIDHRDYPDYCDAYLSHGVNLETGKELTDAELDELSDKYADEIRQAVYEGGI